MSPKFFGGALFGAAAGAAVTWLLTSERGKEIVADLKAVAGKVSDEVKSTVSQFETEINETIDKGKAFAEDMKKKAQDFSV
jgi:gas vesicle protein